MQQAIRAVEIIEPDACGDASGQAQARTGMVVIPARNEEAAVPDVVAEAIACGYAVTVVDDGSTDRTAERAAAAGAVVLRLAFHAGSWAAIQAGMRFAQKRECDYVITMDADGQHNADAIPALVAELGSGDSPNVVIGACLDRANMRRRVAWRALRWLSGLDIQDLTSGFRIYDCQALDLLTQPHQTLLEYQDVGVLLCLHSHGMRVREIEVPMCRRAHGISRIFSSWPMVVYYLVYSTLIGTSRRGYRTRPPE